MEVFSGFNKLCDITDAKTKPFLGDLYLFK